MAKIPKMPTEKTGPFFKVARIEELHSKTTRCPEISAMSLRIKLIEVCTDTTLSKI